MEHTDNNSKPFSVEHLSSFLETFMGVTSERLVTLIYNHALEGQDRRDLLFVDVLEILSTLLSFRRPRKFIKCNTLMISRFDKSFAFRRQRTPFAIRGAERPAQVDSQTERVFS